MIKEYKILTLNKRYLRNIKENLSFYISITLLTAIVICLYLTCASSYRAVDEYMKKTRTDSHVEDGQFVTYTAMTAQDREELEEAWNVEIEQQSYMDLTEDTQGFEVRVFTPNEKVDVSVITEGRELQAEDEILISPLLAEKNQIHIGDRLTLSGTEYTVVGFCVRYDYMFCLKNVNDTFSIPASFGVGEILPGAFAKLDQEDVSRYEAILYHEDNEWEVRKDLYDRFRTANYVAAENNNRIATAQDQMKELAATNNEILPGCLAFMVILIAAVLGRKIKNERRMIGILNALGYKKRELALHYSVFGMIPGLLGSLLGIVLAKLILKPFGNLVFEDKLEPLPVGYHLMPRELAIGILFTVGLYTITVLCIAYVQMRETSVNMIRGTSSKKKKVSFRLSSWKASFRTKYRFRAVFGNLGRSLIVLIGIGIGGLILAFGYACNDSIDQYVDETVDATGSYQYEYFLNTIKMDLLKIPVGEEHVLAANFAVKGYSDSLTLLGMSKNEYMPLLTENGEELEPQDGKYYLSDMAAMIYGVKKGDVLTFYDVASLQEFTVTIDDIFCNGSQSLLVSSRMAAMDLYHVPGNFYNVVMSDHELELKDSEIYKRISKQELIDQIRTTISAQMHNYMGILILFGMVISVITIYLMVNVLLMENVGSISMLKVLGYHDREINRIVTNVYHFLAPLGILLGLVLGVFLNKMNFEASVAVYNTYITSTIHLDSVLKYVIVMAASYVISMLLLRRKVQNVSMVESLKNNRE